MNKLFVSLLACTAVLAFSSCEDNDDPVWGNATNTHRVIQVTEHGDGTDNFRQTFVYGGDKVLSTHSFDNDETLGWVESEREEISYLGDHIYLMWYTKDEDGVWVSDRKARYIVRNGLMMEELVSHLVDGEWVESAKWVYAYDGSRLTSWNMYDYVDGVTLLAGEGLYTYVGENLMSAVSTYLDDSGATIYSELVSFEYAGNKISGFTEVVLDSEDQTQMAYRVDNLYGSNRLIAQTPSFWDSDTDTWIDGTARVFIYDSFNNMVQRGTDTDWTEFEYEAGNGNALFFTSYPESMVYGMPSLKRAVDARQYIPYHLRLLTQITQ